MTPDMARELLDTARQEAGDGQRPVTVAAKYAPLAEAAYALAETVANLHYEYAVQNAETGAWLREDVNGLILYMKNPLVADWGTDREEAEKYAAWIAGETLTEHRVVRRLVSDVEVVE